MGSQVSLAFGFAILTIALLGTGCATLQQGPGVYRTAEPANAMHTTSSTEAVTNAVATSNTPAVDPVDPVEVILQVQEMYFQHEGIGTKRDANGNLHLLVNDDSLCFVFGQAQLKPKSAIPLRHLATVLLGYPESRLTISGHTDNVGSDAVNLRLSQERADALRGALLLYGVPPRTIASATGYGEAHPIADNNTEVGRAMNRRVDLRIAIDASEAAVNQRRFETQLRQG